MVTTAPVTSPAASAPSGAVAAADATQRQATTPAPLIQAYDPTNATPYQAPVLPGVDQASPTAADALPPDQDISQFGAAPPVAGAAAVANQFMRGILQGVAVSKVDQAIRLHRTNQAMQQNLDAASQDLYNLAKSGVDQNSPEYKAAQDRVSAAWKPLMDFYGEHAPGVQIDKKTGQPKPQKKSILDRLKGNDPAEVSGALYEGMLKAGPPVFHQVRQFQTPQYRQYVASQGAAAQAALGSSTAQSIAATKKAELEKTVYTLSQLATRTPEQERQLQNAREGLQSLTKPLEYTRSGQVDGKWYEWKVDENGHEIADTRRPLSTAGLNPSSKPHTGWVMFRGKPASVELDENNQPKWGTINTSLIPPAYLLPSIRMGYITFQGGNGHTYQVPTSTVTTHGYGGGSSATVPSTAPPVSNPSAHKPDAKQADEDSAIPAGLPKGTRDLGVRQSPVTTNAQTTAASTERTYDAAKKLFANFTPAASNTLSLLYVQATNSVAKGNVRMTNTEIKRSYDQAIGSIPARFRAKIWQASQGTMPPDVAQGMLNVIQSVNEAAQDEMTRIVTGKSNSPSAPTPEPSDGDDLGFIPDQPSKPQ